MKNEIEKKERQSRRTPGQKAKEMIDQMETTYQEKIRKLNEVHAKAIEKLKESFDNVEISKIDISNLQDEQLNELMVKVANEQLRRSKSKKQD